MVKQDVTPSYYCEVREVISGDDLILLVDLNIDDLYKRVRARLMGVDTPSAYKQDEDAEAGRVRGEVRKMTRNRRCRINVYSQGRGGWLVTLFIVHPDNTEVEINKVLRDMGFVYAPNKEKRNGDAAKA